MADLLSYQVCYLTRFTCVSSFFCSVRLRSREDLADYGGFGVGVVLGVFPGLMREFFLGALVELAISFVAAEPVAEEQHAVYFGAALREDVKVDICVRSLEHAVLEPVWLADA